MTRWLHRLLGCWPFLRAVERPFAIHHYSACRVCGARRVARSGCGYQPIDHDWLEGGA